MINQQGQQVHENMQTGTIPQQLNHGGHEFFDLSEVLSSAISAMNQYTLVKDHIKDQELRNILDRQLAFMQQEYNTTLESFKTGSKPSVSTKTYNMKEDNDFIYGLKPSQPKKPVQSASELGDQCISYLMLNTVKSAAPMKAKAALECTNPVVRRVLADSVPNCIEMAYEISLYQNKHHYYQVPQLKQEDMQQLLNSFAPAQGMQGGMTH
ncbi:spore coat protein [Metabacillus fastidiosus]|uniref:spore coat protein n=1 Tax=Metabacillus fastidiosus TaxID=1458 RepID=UPI002DB55D71|nr:spore coat protein [Metabacillus fastidiosus]MEC2074874.1 spore coat protein [Metabacillus fastidiosus]